MDQQLHHFYTSDGSRVAYSLIGEGPLLVQAGPRIGHLALEMDIAPIRAMYNALAGKFSVVRYDTIGYGLSDWRREQFSLASEIRILDQLIAALGVDRFSLWGADIAGPVAIAYAAEHPEQIANLILFGTYVSGSRAHRSSFLPDAFRALMLDHWAFATRLFISLGAPDADGATIQALSQLMFRSTSGDNAVRVCDELLYKLDIAARLPQVAATTTVIHRAHDGVCAYQNGRELVARIANSRLVPLEGTSHFPFVGNIEALVGAIDAAMRVDTRASRNTATPNRLPVAGGARTLPQDSVACTREETLRAPLSGMAAPLEVLSEMPTAGLAKRVVMKREGDYWTLEHEGEVFRLRDSRGFGYLVQLLRHPVREFRATELEARSESRRPGAIVEAGLADPDGEELAQAGLRRVGASDAGPVLDSRAKAEYRKRLSELSAELEEAKQAGEERAGARIEQELEFLTRELTRAVGLGGRDRRSASDIHRARVNVSRAVRRSIEKIRGYNPAIANALTLSIKLGIICVYHAELEPSLTFVV
jgi:pimeloyl-ACP methyl ester carboxylesterase